jgi:hypothetical protein
MQIKGLLKIIALFMFFCFSGLSYSQTDTSKQIEQIKVKKVRLKDTTGKWTFFGTSTISTNQSQFSNWQQGGINSISLTTGLNLNLGYMNQTISWQNVFDVNYGLSLQGNSSEWYKNDDRISFSTKLGLKARKSWYYTIITSCSTQFQPGYNSIEDQLIDFKASNFFAPATFISSLGIDYNPSPKLSVFIGPISSKNIIVNDQTLANMGVGGITPAEYDYVTGKYLNNAAKHMVEMGGYIKVQFFEPRVLKNISIQSTLELFNNYLRNASRIDVNIQNDINIKLNEYISTNIILNLKYDDDVLFDDANGRRGPRIQFMQVLGVGLAINLGRMY